MNLISDKQRKMEIGAVVLTGLGKFFSMDSLEWKFPFILISILGWTGYVVYQKRRLPGILHYWGFRTDNFWRVAKMILPFGFASVVFFFLIGFYRGTINITWHIFLF
jgi:hypothetical protein